jgi:hypothetical protein
MFDPKNKRNHYGLSRELDSAFAALVADLATTRTKDGETLLEKTFIVCMFSMCHRPFLNEVQSPERWLTLDADGTFHVRRQEKTFRMSPIRP